MASRLKSFLASLARPERACALIILAGIVLRVMTALATIDQVHPDEHFQTLEPAAKAIYGFGWLSWEWTMGLRSWFVPMLYMPLLLVLKIFGVVGGLTPIYACRIMQALASGVFLWGFSVLLARAGFRGWIRVCVLAMLALSPAMVAWGPTTLSDNWALILLWGAMPWLLAWIFDGRSSRLFIAGLVVGIGFLVRIQMALWGGAMGLCLLSSLPDPYPKRMRALFVFGAGYCAAIGLQGALDWITWGSFLHSTITNIQMNLFQNAGATYGTGPWYDYFRLLMVNPGWPWIVLLVGLFGANVVTRSLRARPGDQLVLIPAALFVAGHCFIPHKEVRFILPAFPAILYAIALFAQNLIDRYLPEVQGKSPEAARVAALGISPAALGAGLLFAVPIFSFSVWPQVGVVEHYSFSNMSELMISMRKSGALVRHPDSCVLLLDHYWVWSHGELLQGHPVRYVEKRGPEVTPHDLDDCDYVVTTGSSEPYFSMLLERLGGEHWEELLRNKYGYSLYMKIGT